jgi:hypothetical protein
VAEGVILPREKTREPAGVNAEEKNFRRFADFVIHGVVPDDLKGTDTSADA